VIATGTSLLLLLVGSTVASAACDNATGARIGPPAVPGDLCDTVAGVQTADSDGDGYGNACDADYAPARCRVGIRDFRIFRANFGKTVPPGNPDTDHSDPPDALIGIPDYMVFSSRYGRPEPDL
jgi:hypothetical protein